MGPCAEAEVEEGDVGESVRIHIKTGQDHYWRAEDGRKSLTQVSLQ